MRNCFNELKEALNKQMQIKTKIIIAIDGNSGAGKSYLANLLLEKYDANICHMDDFFLQPHQRTPVRLKEVGGNIDYERFKSEVLDKLTKEEPFKYRRFSCKTREFVDVVVVKPKPINIIEGVYSLHPTLINSYDFKIFLAVNKQTQLRRIESRNEPTIVERYVREWIPMEEQYFDFYDIINKCDFVCEIEE